MTILSMTEPKTDSAFPLADHGEVLNNGLTKRELFAAMALQGLLAAETEDYNWGLNPAVSAEKAVEHADALIAELQRQT